MKRVIVFLLLFSLFVSNISFKVFAAETKTSSTTQKKIMIYLKPDVTVELNNVMLAFRDSKGTTVYPVIYNGSAYLPVRAMSGLMKEPIEWDGASKTVFIGKTLSNPNEDSTEISTSSVVSYSAIDNANLTLRSEIVTAYLKPDVLVMYDFALQTFRDANGDQVYPIIYNGTTYLPIRAISELMKEPIEWDGATKTILIGDGEDTPEIEEKQENSLAAKSLKNLFEREEVLYYEATAKTTGLKETVSLDEKQIIAAAISDNYLKVQNLTLEIKAVNISNYTDEEIAAYNKIAAFAESTEYYILVLENIAYLAAQDSDYSMLAETFLYFAMDSQTKMDEARISVLELTQ